jgi:hypothetical protein
MRASKEWPRSPCNKIRTGPTYHAEHKQFANICSPIVSHCPRFSCIPGIVAWCIKNCVVTICCLGFPLLRRHFFPQHGGRMVILRMRHFACVHRKHFKALVWSHELLKLDSLMDIKQNVSTHCKSLYHVVNDD